MVFRILREIRGYLDINCTQNKTGSYAKMTHHFTTLHHIPFGLHWLAVKDTDFFTPTYT